MSLSLDSFSLLLTHLHVIPSLSFTFFTVIFLLHSYFPSHFCLSFFISSRLLSLSRHFLTLPSLSLTFTLTCATFVTVSSSLSLSLTILSDPSFFSSSLLIYVRITITFCRFPSSNTPFLPVNLHSHPFLPSTTTTCQLTFLPPTTTSTPCQPILPLCQPSCLPPFPTSTSDNHYSCYLSLHVNYHSIPSPPVTCYHTFPPPPVDLHSLLSPIYGTLQAPRWWGPAFCAVPMYNSVTRLTNNGAASEVWDACNSCVLAMRG